MSTYEAVKKVLVNGKKTKEVLKNMCDIFLLNQRITKEEYQELIGLME